MLVRAAQRICRFASFSPWGRIGFRGLTLAALAVAAASVSREAHAHASDRAFVLLLPTEYYLAGGTLAVAASAAVLAFVPARRLLRLAAMQSRVFEIPSVLAALASLASFAILLLLVIAGLTGSRDPLANPLPLAVWTLWWVGFTLLVAAAGNLWIFVNPWSGAYRLVSGFLRSTPPFAYPAWLGYWPAVLLFLAFAWFELVYPAPDDPGVLAVAVIVYWSLTMFAILLFGEPAWLARGEPFSVLFRYLGGLSPMNFQRGGSCPRLRVTCSFSFPGARLAFSEALPASGVLLILLALASVSFDGLSKTFWWLGLNGINPLEHPGRTVLMARNTLGLLLTWAVLTSVYLLCARGRAGRAVFSIMPIALAYHFSHYLTALLVNGQYAWRALADPFATGRNWLGLDPGHVTTSFLGNRESVTVIWNLQAGSIVACHILAVLLARLIFAETSKAPGVGELPLAAAMVLYTLFGLWLMSTPVAG